MIRRLTTMVGAVFMMAVVAAPVGAESGRALPADPAASESVHELLSNLQDAADPTMDTGFLFGQQHANWDSIRERRYPAGWGDWRAARVRIDELNTFSSDIELAASLFPASSANKPSVYGFNVRTALKVSDEARIAYARQIVAAYATGSIVTMHFPADNPATGGNHKSVTGNPMCDLATDWSAPPESAAATVATWTAQLDQLSAFLDEVNDAWRDPDLDGVDERHGTVAIIFRPFHEMTGISHWWAGRFFRPEPGVCELTPPQAYRTMWRNTVEYLTLRDDPATVVREGLDRHEFLFAWSPGRPTVTPDWKKYHPNRRLDGEWALDDYVDIAGVDIYERSLATFRRQLTADITAMDAFVARQSNNKRDVLALTEFGAKKGFAHRVDADWYNAGLLDALTEAGVADRMAYAMTWTNRTDDLFWVPVPCFNVDGCPDLAGIDQRVPGDGAQPITDWGFGGFIANPLTTLQHDLPDWWRMPEERIEPVCPPMLSFTAMPPAHCDA